MKVSSSNARKDSTGRHNDRNFNLNAAPHIDQSRSEGNKYYTYNGTTMRFSDLEYEFYAENFSDYLNNQNKKRSAYGNKNRNQNMKQYFSGKNTRPEGRFLQVGNAKKHATPEELWVCALEYKDRFEELYGEHCKILDMALHVDEETPHVQLRRVWIADTEDGKKKVSQTQALEQLGITEPDTSMPVSRWNNSKITFTYADRALFRDICIEHGLDIDKEPEEKKHSLPFEEYKRKMLREDKEELERELTALRQEIDQAKSKVEQAKEEVEELDTILDDLEEFFSQNNLLTEKQMNELAEAKRNDDKKKRLRLLLKVYRDSIKSSLKDTRSFEAAIYKADKEAALRRAEKFIEEHGLMEEYSQIEAIRKSKEPDKEPDEPERKKVVF